VFHINASEAQDDNGRCLTPEHALRIDPNDFIRAPARVDRKEDGNGAPHDMGVAVALEDEARRGPGGGRASVGLTKRGSNDRFSSSGLQKWPR
jgi:hypothetical protein